MGGGRGDGGNGGICEGVLEEIIDETCCEWDEDGEEDLHLGAWRDVGKVGIMEEGPD